MDENVNCLRCCVYGCNNEDNLSDIELYKIPKANILFPHGVLRRTTWIDTIRLANPDGGAWEPQESDRICSKHFIGNKKSDDPRSSSYNPTIFPNAYNTLINTEEATNLYRSCLKRISVEEEAVIIPFKKIKSADSLQKDLATLPVSVNNKTHRVEVPQKVDREVQVYFPERVQEVQEVCVCIRYVTITGCDAETQACGPAPHVKGYISNLKVVNTNKIDHSLDNTNKIDHSSDNTNKIDHSLVKDEEIGFRGYSSIKHEQEMIDLGGVTLNTFQLLLKVLSNDSEKHRKNDGRRRMSDENKLLIFLVKMKCALSFSALSVLFNVHRSTISRSFYSTWNYLTSACKDFRSLIPPEMLAHGNSEIARACKASASRAETKEKGKREGTKRGRKPKERHEQYAIRAEDETCNEETLARNLLAKMLEEFGSR